MDSRTDIWSIGVVLYEALAGRLPFASERDESIIFAIRHDQPKPVSALVPDVPGVLDKIIARCLAKSPDDRYQEAAELLADLSRLRKDSGTSIEATPAAVPKPVTAWSVVRTVVKTA